jgi:di/tricarboxylate transporter
VPSPAVLSLSALLVVIVVSLTSRINVGVLGLALAWLVAVVFDGWKPDALMAVFPSALFLTLVGVTLLFGAAEKNRTLAALTDRAVTIFGRNVAFLPWLFFIVAGVVSSVGPGAVAATALVAPLAMATAASTGISPFLMALMVGNGANAGNLSPFSSVGLIVQAQMLKAGIPGHEWNVFLANFVAHTLAATVAYLLFRKSSVRASHAGHATGHSHPSLTSHHWITIALLVVWIAGIVIWKMNPGLTALAAATVLILIRAADDRAAISAIPWSSHCHGLWRQRARRRAREDRWSRAVLDDALAADRTEYGERHDGLRDRADLDLQLHVRRRVSGFPADHPRIGPEARRRRSTPDRAQY